MQIDPSALCRFPSLDSAIQKFWRCLKATFQIRKAVRTWAICCGAVREAAPRSQWASAREIEFLPLLRPPETAAENAFHQGAAALYSLRKKDGATLRVTLPRSHVLDMQANWSKVAAVLAPIGGAVSDMRLGTRSGLSICRRVE